MMRRALALLLLGAHVLAALHLALAEHVMGAGGEAVEVSSCTRPEHAAGVEHGHARGEAGECEAFAWVRAAATWSSPEQARLLPSRSTAALVDQVAWPPLDPLCVAPKGSPPA